MRKVVGIPASSFASIIGEVTVDRLPFYMRYDKILVTDTVDLGCMGYLAILTTASAQKQMLLPHIVGQIQPEELKILRNGDIVSVSAAGEVTSLWEAESLQNSLILTDTCNCHCVMCPQPPLSHNPATFTIANRILDLLRRKPVEHICLTGGEPTLLPNNFFAVLKRCHKEHPRARVSILTNARQCADSEFQQNLSSFSNEMDMYCVSLHSDIPEIHDEIVGVKGSYDETQKGVYNLAKNRLQIEIRHVISRFNYTRLVEFAEHMYRYFPFCSHVAFMSMEIHGLASDNYETINIDPIEYKEELRQAVLALNKRGLPVSVYNTPLCLCHKDIWSFARQSISSWKNVFLKACESCLGQDRCCGFFSTSSVLSKNIFPIL